MEFSTVPRSQRCYAVHIILWSIVLCSFDEIFELINDDILVLNTSNESSFADFEASGLSGRTASNKCLAECDPVTLFSVVSQMKWEFILACETSKVIADSLPTE